MLQKALLIFFMIPSLASAKSGEFRGYETMDSIIKERLFPESTQFSLLSMFQFAELPYDFIELLGVYDKYQVSDGTIRNGTPNAFNMILWHTVMNNIGGRLARECRLTVDLSEPVRVRAHIATNLKTLCAWPLPSAKDASVYESLFMDITMYDVPLEEFEAWYEHFVSSGDYDDLPPEKFVRTVTYALLMNPYFLLQP